MKKKFVINKLYTIFMAILTNLISLGTFIYANAYNHMVVFAFMIVIIGFILTIRAVKLDISNSVIVNGQEIILMKNPHERENILLNEICYIKYQNSSLFAKVISIHSQHKIIYIRLTAYKKYKELLKIILDETKGNGNIKVDKKVYGLLG